MGSSNGFFLLKYMPEPIHYFNLSESVLNTFAKIFLNMSICTSTWVKYVCTFAISVLIWPDCNLLEKKCQ